MGLERVVAVINGKGGVGKTSLVANLAGEFAASGGMRVLVVDLDVSRNLVLDFGLVGHEEDDKGEVFSRRSLGEVHSVWFRRSGTTSTGFRVGRR